MEIMAAAVAQRESYRRPSKTTAGTRIPSESPDNQNPLLTITHISYAGCVTYQQDITLIRSEALDVNQALRGIPVLPPGHARIYDYRAGDITRELENHLRPLFPGMTKVEPDPHSLIKQKDRRTARVAVRSQWAPNPSTTPKWNPLHVPCTYFPVKAQYHDLDLGPSLALFVCSQVDGDKLLVLYERPLDFVETSESYRKALGAACGSTFQQDILQDDARPCSVFIKLLLLILFQIHIERLTEICQRTFPATHHDMLYRGAADVPQTIARIRNCTEYHRHVSQLIAMSTLTVSSLETEMTGSVSTGLAEHLLEVRSLGAQLAKMSQDNVDRYEQAWGSYREILDVHESRGVKRLTMLATIFLPLSLSSSILAMSTRLADLHLLLYDFVGVFLILGSVALAFYTIITLGNGILLWLRKQKQLSLMKMIHSEHRGVMWVYRHLILVWLHTGSVVALVIFWVGLTVSFIIGMVDNVIFGLKFLGYFIAGMAAAALIAPMVFLAPEFYLFQTVMDLRRRERANIENGPITTPGASAI